MSALAARRRHPLMLALLLLARAAASPAALYAALAPARGAAPTRPAAGRSTDGKKLFLANCATCHGLNAQGSNDAPRRLIGVGAAAVDFQVGTGRMPAAGPGAQIQQTEVQFTTRTRSPSSRRTSPRSAPGPAIPDAASTRPGAGGDIGQGRRAVPHQLRAVPQLRRHGRRADPRQVRARA